MQETCEIYKVHYTGKVGHARDAPHGTCKKCVMYRNVTGNWLFQET